MNRRARLTVALACMATAVLAAPAQASQSAKHEAQELQRAKLSLIEAIVAAEKQAGGKAINAAFEFKRGNPAYFEVKVLSEDGRKLTRYELNARTGNVQGTSNEALEKLITRITPASLSHAPTGLTHAIALAEQRSGGHAVSADVKGNGEQLVYTVETVKLDGTSKETQVQADGKIESD